MLAYNPPMSQQKQTRIRLTVTACSSPSTPESNDLVDFSAPLAIAPDGRFGAAATASVAIFSTNDLKIVHRIPPLHGDASTSARITYMLFSPCSTVLVVVHQFPGRVPHFSSGFTIYRVATGTIVARRSQAMSLGAFSKCGRFFVLVQQAHSLHHESISSSSSDKNKTNQLQHIIIYETTAWSKVFFTCLSGVEVHHLAVELLPMSPAENAGGNGVANKFLVTAIIAEVAGLSISYVDVEDSGSMWSSSTTSTLLSNYSTMSAMSPCGTKFVAGGGKWPFIVDELVELDTAARKCTPLARLKIPGMDKFAPVFVGCGATYLVSWKSEQGLLRWALPTSLHAPLPTVMPSGEGLDVLPAEYSKDDRKTVLVQMPDPSRFISRQFVVVGVLSSMLSFEEERR